MDIGGFIQSKLNQFKQSVAQNSQAFQNNVVNPVNNNFVRPFENNIGSFANNVGKTITPFINQVANTPIINNPTPFKLPFQSPTVGQTLPALWQAPLSTAAGISKTFPNSPLNQPNIQQGFNNPIGNNISNIAFGQPLNKIQSLPQQFKSQQQQLVGNKTPFNLTPLQAGIGAAGIVAGANALNLLPPELGGGKNLSKAAAYLKQVAKPEDINAIKDFATWVETTGGKGNAAKAGIDLPTIHAIARDVFGEAATNLTNLRLKNAFDATLAEIGKGKNLLNLGLTTQNVREGNAIENGMKQVANAGLYDTKQPWQMTKAEWNKEFEKTKVNFSGTGGQQAGLGNSKVNFDTQLAKQDFLKMGLPDQIIEGMQIPARHYQVVKNAVEQGLPVPKEVLKEYPDLVRSVGAAPTRSQFTDASRTPAGSLTGLSELPNASANSAKTATNIIPPEIQDYYSKSIGGVLKNKEIRVAQPTISDTLGQAKQLVQNLKKPILKNGEISLSEPLPPKPKELLPIQQESQQLTPFQKTANQLENPSGNSIPPGSNSDKYLEELINKQNQARQNPIQGIKSKIGDWYSQIKAQLIDATAPIEDVLSNAEKQNKFQVRPTGDVRLQIDRVYRAETLAGQFAKDNGLVDVIKQAPNLQALDQYLIAKHAAEVATTTGRNAGKDAQLVKDLAPTYEPFAQKVAQYSKALKQYMVDSGLISKDLSAKLDRQYPNYVPLNRIFNETEIKNGFGRKGVASLSKQTVVQKLQGSEREIENPIASFLSKTQQAFEQGERNIAGKQLASYKDLPGFQGLIRELKPGENGIHTFSFLDNGVKKTFETTQAIEAAAKSLDKQQMNLLLKLISIPTRLLRLGATGLNYPFAISNLAKDQISALINSKNAAYTANPIAFSQGLFAALGHGELYQDLVRNAGGGTSFDIGREASNLAVSKLRSPIKYTVTHPTELIRAIENIIGRTEELTRAQQYKGSLDALLTQGRMMEDAKLLAAKSARENTVNFARGGNFTRALNWILPYFNAGVQGARTFTRNLTTRPAQTLTKFAIGAGMPVAAATLWNLSDPARKKAYDDIPEFEKQNSIVIIPPNPTQDADGKWNVIKIPLSQEIASLTNIVRRPIEQAAGLDPVKVGEMANSLFQTFTSLNTQSGTGLASQLTPQIAKPVVETTMNKNLFTGRDIVPSYLQNLPPEQQVKKTTPANAKLVAGALKNVGLNISPLVVQNEANTILGGLGSQLIGTKGFDTALESRFLKASGGDTQQKQQQSLMQGLNPKETQGYTYIHTPKAVDQNGNSIDQNTYYTTPSNYQTYLANPRLIEIDKKLNQSRPQHDPLWDLTIPQIKAYMNAEIISKTNPGGDKTTVNALYSSLPQTFFDTRNQYFNNLVKQGIMQPQAPNPYSVQTPQAVTDFWNNYFKLPQGSAARRQMIQSPLGQQALALSQQKTELTNQQRIDLGLPLLPSTGSSGSSGTSSYVRSVQKRTLRQMAKPRTHRVKAIKTKKPKKIHLKTVPKLKRLSFANPKQPKLRLKNNG